MSLGQVSHVEQDQMLMETGKEQRLDLVPRAPASRKQKMRDSCKKLC